MDNLGRRLMIEEMMDINTPAIGAAYVVKDYTTDNIETEISLQVGDIISVIEMPPPTESFYWKGKKGLEVGYFPAECVQLIDCSSMFNNANESVYSLRPLNKLSTSPSFAKQSHHLGNFQRYSLDAHNQASHHNGLQRIFTSLRTAFSKQNEFASNYQSTPSGSVFGVDLAEYLALSQHSLPPVLVHCAKYIEQHGSKVTGIYRISGVKSLIDKLKSTFDQDIVPLELIQITDSTCPDSDKLELLVDVHAVSSLLKQYFRDLPEPLLTYNAYDSFVTTMSNKAMSADARLHSIRSLVMSLPLVNWRTLRHLIRHLNFMSQFSVSTGMTVKNLSIVWAPNLLRKRELDEHLWESIEAGGHAPNNSSFNAIDLIVSSQIST